MTDPVRIDALPTAAAATAEDLLPAMRDGDALVLTVDQLRQLIADSLMPLLDSKLALTGGTLTGPLGLNTVLTVKAAAANGQQRVDLRRNDNTVSGRMWHYGGSNSIGIDLHSVDGSTVITRMEMSGATPGTVTIGGSPIVTANSGWLQLSRAIVGMTLSNAVADPVNDITVAAGLCASDGTQPALMQLASAITKRTDAAWAAGNNAGGWLDGAAMPDGTGHVFAIRRPDTGQVDVGLSASLTPALPTNYTQRRRIGSVLRAAAALRPFQQVNDRFIFVSPVTDISSTTLRAAAPLTLSVPSGLPVRAQLRVKPISAAGSILVINSDAFSCYSTTTATYMSYEVAAQTNSSRQVTVEATGTAGSLPWSVETTGWIDELRSV